MNSGDLIVLTILLIIVTAIVTKMIRDRKRGNSCCGDCSGCHGCHKGK